MNNKSENLAQEAIEHSGEAAELLKKSNKFHELGKQGIIEENQAADEALKLNEQAIQETEKAIELQKEFLAEQENK